MLLRALIRNNIISKEEEIFYGHGLDILVSTFWLIGTILTLGFLMGMAVETIIFLTVFVGLRYFTGGYHAKKRWKCYCISNLVYLTVLVLTKASIVLKYRLIVIVCVILSVYSIITIWCIAPILGVNSIKNEREIQLTKDRGRIISTSLIIGAIIGMLLFKEGLQFFLVIILTVTEVALLLKISYFTKEE